MILHLPELSLVLLVGPSGAGKTKFARRHFLPSEIVSSDTCRAMVWNNRKHEAGPFDIIGDIRSCHPELLDLLDQLGWQVENHVARHPENRRLVFVGDLVDRGPDSPNVLRLAMASCAAGTALCVPGNHDMKFLRWLNHSVNIDTGCCFGGRLTALRYPELDTVSVAARATYSEPAHPLRAESRPDAQLEHYRLLDLDDLLGNSHIHTALRPAIKVRGENLLAAIELMSRFAVLALESEPVDPRL